VLGCFVGVGALGCAEARARPEPVSSAPSGHAAPPAPARPRAAAAAISVAPPEERTFSGSRLLLGEIPVKVAPSLAATPLPPPERVSVRLLADDPAVLAKSELCRRVTRGPPRVAEGLVATLAMPSSQDAPRKEHLAASFLVDYEEPAVAKVVGELAPTASPDDAVLLVARHIERKDFTRGFDIASRVAETRRGDCTEHAVLLAAVLRAHKIPARVVLGLVVLTEDGRWLSFGHAWVEYHRGAQWQVADAALDTRASPSSASTRFPRVAGYLPLDVIREEGPGFARSMIDTSLPHVRRIELGLVATPVPRARNGTWALYG
jgi:transglutaminase-like putative cysteine protease